MSTTTTTTQAEENPSKTLITTDHQQPPPSDSDSHHHPTEAAPEFGDSPAIRQPPPPSSAAVEASQKESGDESKAIEGDPVKSDSGGGDSVTPTDTLKKIRRAERFGMPVKLSEEEKRNSRAERYIHIYHPSFCIYPFIIYVVSIPLPLDQTLSQKNCYLILHLTKRYNMFLKLF